MKTVDMLKHPYYAKVCSPASEVRRTHTWTKGKRI